MHKHRTVLKSIDIQTIVRDFKHLGKIIIYAELCEKKLPRKLSANQGV